MPCEVLIGILASGHKDKTLACLDSLAASRFRDFEVLLVDNGSGEDLTAATASYDFVTVLAEPSNIGAAAGRNIILRHYRQGTWPYLLLLDNDMYLPPETLTQTVRYLSDAPSNLGALGIPIVYSQNPETCWSSGGATLDWEQCWFGNDGQGVDLSKLSEPCQIDTIPTAFMLARRQAVEAAGYFVEDYFIYLEDTEWCWAMKGAGYELCAVPIAHALHDVSSSLGHLSPRFYYLRTRNRFWFFTAHTRVSRWVVRRRILKDVLLNSFYPELRAGHVRAAAAVLRGVVAGQRLPRTLAS